MIQFHSGWYLSLRLHILSAHPTSSRKCMKVCFILSLFHCKHMSLGTISVQHCAYFNQFKVKMESRRQNITWRTQGKIFGINTFPVYVYEVCYYTKGKDCLVGLWVAVNGRSVEKLYKLEVPLDEFLVTLFYL